MLMTSLWVNLPEDPDKIFLLFHELQPNPLSSTNASYGVWGGGEGTVAEHSSG